MNSDKVNKLQNPIQTKNTQFICSPDTKWQWNFTHSGTLFIHSQKLTIQKQIFMKTCTNVTQFAYDMAENLYIDKRVHGIGCMSPVFIPADEDNNVNRVVSRLWIYTHNKNIKVQYPFSYNQLVMTYLNENNSKHERFPNSVLGIISHTASRSTGSQDPRYFHLPNNPYGRHFLLFGQTIILKETEVHQMHIWSFEKQILIHLRLNSSKLIYEKNWSIIDLTTFPVEEKHFLYFVYHIIPLTVVRCDLRIPRPLPNCFTFFTQKAPHPKNSQKTHLAGGTNFHRYKNTNYFFAIIHSRGDECRVSGRRYTSHLMVIYWPNIFQPDLRTIFIGDPFSFTKEFLNLKPKMYVEKGFFFPVSLFEFDEDNDLVHVGGHRSNEECWFIRIKGIFAILQDILNEASQQSSGNLSALDLYQSVVGFCDRWSKGNNIFG